MPAGFAAWVAKLLAKRPEDRFVRAADAAWALCELESTAIPSRRRTSRDPLPASLHTLVLDRDALAGAPPASVRGLADPTSCSLPPLPASPLLVRPSPAPPLAGAGLGLFGIRSIPLVDRERVLTALWSSLREVYASGRPRAIVLRGPAGTGKSRIARWIAERADEVGAATALVALHSAQAGRNEGILAMLARHFGCLDMEPEKLADRLGARLAAAGDRDALLANALARLLVGDRTAGEDAEPSGVKASERRHVVARILALLADARPLVVTIDDAQWGLDALLLGAEICAHHPTLPVLLLYTVRDESLAGGSPADLALGALLEHERASVIHVRELAPTDHRQLVRHMLGLSPALAERVAARTEGNPLFAVQLVGDWVARGVLRHGRKGLELEPGQSDELPADVHALCDARMARSLTGRPADERRALELLALLGAEVDESEWLATCARAGLEAPHALVDVGVERGLLERRDGRWRFGHGLMRDALLRLARTSGRWQEHNHVIAQVLAAGPRTAHTAIRIGRHLVDAEELEQAIGAMLQAARLLRVEADFSQARDVLVERASLLDRLAVPSDDPRRAEGTLLAASLHAEQGRLDEALVLADRVAEDARRRGDDVLAARAALVHADAHIRRGEGDAAVELCQRAMGKLAGRASWRVEVEARAALAGAYYFVGDVARAGVAYARNLELAMEVGNDVATADALWGLGYVAMWRDRLDDARGAFERMRELVAGAGAGYRLGDCYNALGEVARLSGRFDEAERHYQASLRVIETYGLRGKHTARTNLALTKIAMGELGSAAPLLVELWHSVEQGVDSVHLEAGILSGILLVRAHEAALPGATLVDLLSWEQAVGRLELLLSQTPLCDGDVASLLSRAAQAALTAGRRDRAQAAARLGLAQWRALGRPDRVAELELLG